MSLYNFVRGDKEVYQLEGLLIPKLNFKQTFGNTVKRRREDLALSHGSVSTTPKNKLAETSVVLKFDLPKEYLVGGIDPILNRLIEKEGKAVSLYWIGHDGFRGDGTGLPYIKLYKTDMVLDSISIYGNNKTKGTNKELVKEVEIQLIFDKFFFLDITNQAKIIDASLATSQSSQWDLTTFDSGVAYGGGASTLATQIQVATMDNSKLKKYFITTNYARPKYPVSYKDFWFPIYSIPSQRYVRSGDPYPDINDGYYTTVLNAEFIVGTYTKNILDFNQIIAPNTQPIDLTGSNTNNIIIIELDGAVIPADWSFTLINKTNNTSVFWSWNSSQPTTTTRNQLYLHTGQVFNKFGTTESSNDYIYDAPSGAMLEFIASSTNDNQLLELRVTSPLACDFNIYVARTLY